LLNHGSLVVAGEPDDVINHYNFLIAKLNDDEENVTIDTNKKDSFGNFDIKIESVSISGQESHSSVISAGEEALLDLRIFSKVNIDDMTVGIMIRDKFGQDIFGTNSFYLQKKIAFRAGKYFLCRFTMPLNIGVGKYTITAAVHTKENHLEHCSHWIDNAASFEIAGCKGNMFVGLCKLDPQIEFKELSQ
jgi:lipopolysaccharide transport system ATP-binding protein